MAVLASYKKTLTRGSIAGGIATLSFVVQLFLGNFPTDLFRFPLNILALTLWIMLITMMYRNRANNAWSRFMLSRKATWLSLAMMTTLGMVLGLEREPSTTAWPVVLAIFFTLSHICFIVLRGWRSAKGLRWRFCLVHIGLFMALGAGFWGAPDREQLRAAVHHYPSNEAYTMEGEQRFLPYTIELESFDIQQSDNGTPTHYEAEIKVDNKVISLKVNHPYSRTLSEKIYLVSFGTSPYGERYAVIEFVNEPWQWVTATGILMLIAGAVLLFVQGPRRTVNGKVNGENSEIERMSLTKH